MCHCIGNFLVGAAQGRSGAGEHVNITPEPLRAPLVLAHLLYIIDEALDHIS